MSILLLAVALQIASDDPAVKGPFNLILRWGPGAPISVPYPTKERCDSAALVVYVQKDPEYDLETRQTLPIPRQVQAPNEPYAFCIPG